MTVPEALLTAYLCSTCGTQFAPSRQVPERCPICEDDRQYVGHQGQQWTTLAQLQQDHRNRIEQQEAGLYGIGTEPAFAIGQRALLVQSGSGNLLWDCISLIDESTIQALKALGGIAAIAISHPHYYSSAVEWAHAFGAPLYLHEADRRWVMRPDAAIHFWAGDTLQVQQEITLIRAGGHFPGGTLCHWATGTEGRGTLLSGDIIQVVADRAWVSFMYSYPNLIPLPATKIRQIVHAVEPYEFDRVYGAWWQAIVASEAKASVHRSADRYIRAIEGRHPQASR
ncbi:MBL fold metallo-hydrolase [Lyngbya confervoides]|uniref:Metallo-beta-lactamase domain-containing protein n=1 Tax=Lyngbya confervoides BDU141951 TaxID=1574623 RepID=A0ABD4T4J7_9CYAN|nr:MBL fold metallo-hydrolase [Lyngbya confervoides]MCM1983589.1 hypothetical protein [Lyngbya confervoides BDU141951]